jgi:hypothetical protein
MKFKFERDCRGMKTTHRLTRQSQKILSTVALAAATVCAPLSVQALPFNQDMVGTQLTNGNIMRPKAAESVPVGASERFIGPKREDALRLTNPVEPTEMSIASGSRLFAINCSPCHGRYIEGEHIPGAVSVYLPGPELSNALYKDKPDAHFFQFIYYGGLAIMPAYGWKLSIEEHWDIVNYIRHLQNTRGQE